MNFGRKQSDLVINLTSLIDVVFLLLLFFVLTTTFRQESPIRIDPPKSPADAQRRKGTIVEVWVDKQGQFFVDKRPVPKDSVLLRQAIKASAAQHKDAPLLICADADVVHEAVVVAMKAATDAGFTSASICTMKTTE